MEPETDPDAVVDHNGCVQGFTNLFVADASVMPTIPRANTHLPVLAVAERIASSCATAEAKFGLGHDPRLP
jgi:choline dehydrogenase